MRLSIQTIAIIKNFSKFQPALIIQPGNIIKVRTPAVYAEATVAETFPTEVRISDVQELFRTVALFRDPEFEFTEDHIRIIETDGTAELAYPQPGPGSLVHLPFPLRMKPEPAEQLTFTVSDEQWTTIQKALGVRGARKKNYWGRTNLIVVSDGKAVRLNTERGYKTTGYSLMVGGVTNGFECNCSFDASTLPLMVGSYQVMLTSTYARFVHSGGYDLRYFVGADTRLSTWGGKQSYTVTATKNVAQECQITVEAYSIEEAEALARQKPAEDFLWTAAPRLTTSFKAVA